MTELLKCDHLQITFAHPGIVFVVWRRGGIVMDGRIVVPYGISPLSYERELVETLRPVSWGPRPPEYTETTTS